jgi:type IV pilus assembly protein PilB
MSPNLERAIYQLRRTDEENHVRDVAKSYNLPYVSLIGYPILPNTLKLITSDDAIRFGAVPFLHVEQRLRVAITEPKQETIDFLQNLADKMHYEISLSICSPTSFKFALNLYLLHKRQAGEQEHIIVNEAQQTKAIAAIQSKEELEEHIATANATQLLDILFAAATGMEASDIHIEPQEANIRVRFRIDGILEEITTLNTLVYKQVLSRVKFLAHMKLDIKQVNQDGRFTIEVAGTDLDVRVSTLPSAYGEIIDMRLLRAHAQFIKLDDLGVSSQGLTMIKEAITRPHGMILITGPTGSGKTTTLYAILDNLNKSGVKIITLEDPIEYRVAGIDQVQIEQEKGLTFAEALLGVLRQDPDIIMVGEIRDKETATIGLQAAMTGHLFLSTLHTNNAPASLARLIDMGIEPYKIAGAINLVIAQRLVRKTCTTCNGAKCAICHQTGYRGRTPIIEVLKPSKALDDAIVNKAAVRDLYAIAINEGMIPMFQDGMEKVKQGVTTEEEVNRVTAEQDNV